MAVIERLYLDGSTRQQSNGLRIFSSGGARTLDANLASHRFLQWQSDFRGDVPDQSDSSTFANGIDCGAHGCINTNGFQSQVNAAPFVRLKYLATRSSPEHAAFPLRPLL